MVKINDIVIGQKLQIAENTTLTSIILALTLGLMSSATDKDDVDGIVLRTPDAEHLSYYVCKVIDERLYLTMNQYEEDDEANPFKNYRNGITILHANPIKEEEE